MNNRWNKRGQRRSREHFQRRKPTLAEINFSKDVIAAATKPKKQYVIFLMKELAAESGSPWTIVSLVTALHRFGKNRGRCDPSMLGPLLSLFATRFNRCTEPLDAQAVGNAFYGLQGIDASALDRPGNDALAAVLNVLAELAGKCTEPLVAQAVSNAFYGLRNHIQSSPNSDQLIPLVVLLVDRIHVTNDGTVPPQQTVRELCCALRCGHDAREDLSKSLDVLWNLLEGLPTWHAQDNPAPQGHLLALMEQEQVYALYDHPVPAELRKTLNGQQAACSQLLKDRISAYEKAVGSLLEGRLKVPVQVGHLLRGFELDLYFQLGTTLYDVELDGPHHLRTGQRLNDEQRDRFLHGEGITVLRIPVQNNSPEAVVDTIMHELGIAGTQNAGK